MSSLRVRLLALADRARSLSGPGGVDIRTHQLTIRVRTWSGEIVREGTYTDSDLVLPQYYPIKHISQSEVEGSGGSYEVGDVLVEDDAEVGG